MSSTQKQNSHFLPWLPGSGNCTRQTVRSGKIDSSIFHAQSTGLLQLHWVQTDHNLFELILLSSKLHQTVKTYEHSHYYWAVEIYLCSFTGHIQEKVFLTYWVPIIHWSQVHTGNFVSFLLQGSKVRYKDAKIQARKYLSKQVHIWY